MMLFNLKEKLKLCYILILACISTSTVFSYLTFNDRYNNGKKVVWLIVFFAFFQLLRSAEKVLKKRNTRLIAFLLALFFSILLSIGDAVRKYSIGIAYPSVIQILFMLAGSFILFAAVLLLFIDWVQTTSFISNKKDLQFFTNNRASFLFVWGTILLCWIPYFIYYYPAIMTLDTYYQLAQSLGLEKMTTHHPVIHTALLALFLKFGELFNSKILGIGFYTLTQMLIMSSIYSYSIYFLAKLRLPNTFRAALWIYFALFPTNAFFSITAWKDILFGGITLLLIIQLTEAVLYSDMFFASVKKICGLTLTIFLFCIFRNNGIYAFILSIPVFIWGFRRYWKKISLAGVVLLLFIVAYKHIVSSTFQIEAGNVGESLSVPLQQIAKVVTDHGSKLTSDERKKINEILPYDRLASLYDPLISDPVKATFNNQVFLKNKGRYASLWFDLLKKYPKTYILSFLCNSYGYWYPDVDYWIVATGRGHDPSNLTGIGNTSPQILISDTKIGNIWARIQNIPVISMLFSIGLMVWLLFLTCIIFISKRRAKLLIPSVILWTLWFTTLASPVHAEYRYIYGLILSVPFLFGIALVVTKTKTHTEEGETYEQNSSANTLL